MKYKVIRTETADVQIRKIILYIAENFGNAVALEKLKKLEQSILDLGDNPFQGVEPRYLVLKRQGYKVLILEKNIVFYKVDEQKKEVIVYAVVDQRQDYLNILSAREQIRATEAAVEQAEEAYKIATVRYRSGVGINLDVLDAQLALNKARTNHITALYNYNVGLATLENAMGIPAVIHPEFTAKK